MPSINENLKLSRQAKEMTQDDVAKKIGVTRQTISSYESGRTQPDLETLKRLAEVYNVELDDILYGRNNMQIKLKTIKIVSVIAMAVLFLCNLAHAVLIWVADKYFHVAVGIVSEDMLPVLNFREALINARNVVDTVSMRTFSLLCIVLLILLILLEHPIPVRTKLVYLAALVAGSAITILPWSLSDHSFYGFSDYSLVAAENLLTAVFFFGLSFIGEHIHAKKKTQ